MDNTDIGTGKSNLAGQFVRGDVTVGTDSQQADPVILQSKTTKFHRKTAILSIVRKQDAKLLKERQHGRVDP